MSRVVSDGSACAAVRLLGADTEVMCADGRTSRYVNLDYAASTPALPDVWSAVEEFMPWYSSVHRGSGIKSQVATDAFEGTRDVVMEFVGAPSRDDVVFVRNTTEGINVLAATLPAGTRVLSSPVEHHANMLPWRRHDLQLLPLPESADALCADCERTLSSTRPAIDLVAVTGASNVTGEVWPLGRLAEIAHRHGAQLFVDGAQLAPHRPIDMAADGIDFLAVSGHKLYAPFGAGALVGPVSRLGDAAPLLHGGGAIKLVTLDDVIWADTPDRHEAGSPNVVGVIALGAACRALGALGMEAVAEHERTLADRLRRGLATVPGLEQLAIWQGDHVDRVGVASFVLRGYRHPLLAAILSAEHAIGVRHGCFCAHPLITRLLGIPDAEVRRLHAELRAGGAPPLPGAVRASLGLGTTEADVDRLIGALDDIARNGPAMRYHHVAERDEYQPATNPHQGAAHQCRPRAPRYAGAVANEQSAIPATVNAAATAGAHSASSSASRSAE
jgi:selenocysteine lyase/cysteine desulfurase